jgi:hypothetical protein
VVRAALAMAVASVARFIPESTGNLRNARELRPNACALHASISTAAEPWGARTAAARQVAIGEGVAPGAMPRGSRKNQAGLNANTCRSECFMQALP